MSDEQQRVVDMLGRTIEAPSRPQRIVSLVPSQTELLFHLGVGERIVGVTRYCVHPAAEVSKRSIVGGTKTLRFDIIEALDPDLVIGNMEENERGAIERLAGEYPVWLSDVRDLPGALAMIRAVGGLVDRAREADALAADIETAFAHLPRLPRPLRVAYVIWRKPYMVAGRSTFIDAMLTRCGFENAFGTTPASTGRGESDGGPDRESDREPEVVPDRETGRGSVGASDSGPDSAPDEGPVRYPTVTADELKAAHLDLLLLASEPFPFDEVYRAEFVEILPDVDVRLVDGEMFSWYGNRLIEAAEYLRSFVDNVAKSHST